MVTGCVSLDAVSLLAATAVYLQRSTHTHTHTHMCMRAGRPTRSQRMADMRVVRAAPPARRAAAAVSQQQPRALHQRPHMDTMTSTRKP
jgi:hypothetical protein